MINPDWFEDLITFLAIYYVVVAAIIYFLGWRIYKWWDSLKK